MKIFVHNEKTFYYVVKDISWKEVGNKEMANAFMEIFDENCNAKVSFAIYDERNKVMNNLPNDAHGWYDGYLNKVEG